MQHAMNHHQVEAAASPQLQARAVPNPTESVLEALEYALTQGQGANPLLIARTARRLGMSARTLQRRLRASGTSFSDLLRRKREFCAVDMLCQGQRSIAEIADALGFSEHSAFTRAFKRWTGSSPAHFRSARRGRLTLLA
jgi:AraC-like DNA-binding protein